MKNFPKKYKEKDLKNRSESFRQKTKNNTSYSINWLPISKKINCSDFLPIYYKDFSNYLKNIKNNETSYINLFLYSNDDFENICSSFLFFEKKKQNLKQVWTKKLERYITSQKRKKVTANNKIIDTYLSSKHKIYFPDSDFYIYTIEKLKTLFNEWKIHLEKNIAYRSFNLQTSIPKEHITRKKEERFEYIIKYFVSWKSDTLPVYADQVDLCCWDVALLVHPKDKRYNKHIGKQVIIPFCNRKIPVIWDNEVNIALNNWIKRVCPCCDEESITLAKKYKLPTDIFVFDKNWIYLETIHDEAFIWQNRKTYYNNIVGYLWDIGNKDQEIKIIKEIPYLESTGEELIPYQISQIVLDISEEKEQIIDMIIKQNFKNFFFYQKAIQLSQSTSEVKILDNIENLNPKQIENFQTIIKKDLMDKIPSKIICNSQIPYWRKIPFLIKENGNLEFFDIENFIQNYDWNDLQRGFDLIILNLIRIWNLYSKEFWDNQNKNKKICDYDKLFSILSQNEKEILYFIKFLQNKYWEKLEYSKLIKIIQNLTDENNSTIEECSKLIEHSNVLKIEWNSIFIKIEWLSNEILSPDFLQHYTLPYLCEKNIDIQSDLLITENNIENIITDLIFQKIITWKFIFNQFSKIEYNIENESKFKNLTLPQQIQETQRNIFSAYWENPVRLWLLTNKTFNQEEIIINNFFLKQIRNAIRFCTKNKLLANNIDLFLSKQPETFEDIDLYILNKLKLFHNRYLSIENSEEYIEIFNEFRENFSNLFCSRYLEIQKLTPSTNSQYVCSYAIYFLLKFLYPIIPQFVDALSYITDNNYIIDIKPPILNKWNYTNINIFYETFLKIKQQKIDLNIKQHESLNLYFKSSSNILDSLRKYEKIFKSFFHINEIDYLKLHEEKQWYKIIHDENIITFEWLEIWIQKIKEQNEYKETLESLEKDLKDLKDKEQLVRQRIISISNSEQRSIEEEKLSQIKEEIENLSIKIQLMNK